MNPIERTAVEFEDAWLEARSCAEGDATGADDKMLAVPAISEVLEAAANANGRPGLWDYSRRLKKGEEGLIKNAIRFTRNEEDYRSISLSANVSYKGSCYTLTLFAVKRSQ